MTKNYITVKRMTNRRFSKTEQAILDAIMKNPETNLSKLTKDAQIARSTFYHHHKTILSIGNDYEKYLRTEYRKRVKMLLRKKKASLEYLYRDALFFVLTNKKLFQVLTLQKEGQAFHVLVEQIKPNFIAYARLPKNCEKIFQIYAKEVEAIFLAWYKNNFAEENVDDTLKDIMILSKNARQRLLPLLS